MTGQIGYSKNRRALTLCSGTEDAEDATYFENDDTWIQNKVYQMPTKKRIKND